MVVQQTDEQKGPKGGETGKPPRVEWASQLQHLGKSKTNCKTHLRQEAQSITPTAMAGSFCSYVFLNEGRV